MEVLYTKSVGFSVSFKVGIILTTTYESCNSIENLGEPASPSVRMEILEKHSSILFLPIQPSFRLRTILHTY